MRKFVVALFSCAVLSAVLVANTPSEASAQTVSGEEVMAQAQSYVGTPYGTGGLDCSGFTSAVYADLGVSLPDDPVAQYSYGVPSEAAAGDLVFFDEAGYGISHVGIATGYGTVIHASTYYGTITETPISQVPGYVGAVAVS
jgi:cell wall-associated NlpC family hydrolase